MFASERATRFASRKVPKIASKYAGCCLGVVSKPEIAAKSAADPCGTRLLAASIISSLARWNVISRASIARNIVPRSRNAVSPAAICSRSRSRRSSSREARGRREARRCGNGSGRRAPTSSRLKRFGAVPGAAPMRTHEAQLCAGGVGSAVGCNSLASVIGHAAISFACICSHSQRGIRFGT